MQAYREGGRAPTFTSPTALMTAASVWPLTATSAATASTDASDGGGCGVSCTLDGLAVGVAGYFEHAQVPNLAGMATAVDAHEPGRVHCPL